MNLKQKIIAHIEWAGTSEVADVAKATGATNKEIADAVNAESRLMWLGKLVGFETTGKFAPASYR